MESERERAGFYQAHKDDPHVWDELEESPAPPRARRTGLSVSIAVRFAPQEAEAIRRTARQMGATYSEVVRKAVQAYTHPDYELKPNQENLLPIFESTTPRTVPSALSAHFDFGDRLRAVQTRSSAAEPATR